MPNLKIKMILFIIAFFSSFSVQAQECQNYFRKSDLAQRLQLSMKEFRALESLADLEISASDITNVHLKTATLDEVQTKLAEMAQAGIRIEAYKDIKKLVLKEMKRRKELEEKRLREQEQLFKDSIIDGKRAIFHRIEPGHFPMGKLADYENTYISQPFEMMATQTTQIIWRTIAELANSKLSGKYHINIDPSKFKGDTRPVESVSLEEIQTWITALNELSQLGEPVLAELISTHKRGDVYRLPKEAEWEFTVRGPVPRVINKTSDYSDYYHFGEKESELSDYAWFKDNSGKETHPVAQKKALILNGNKKFFDFYGNVWEVMADKWNGSSPLPGGIDPIGTEGPYQVVRGGCYFSDAQKLRSVYRGFTILDTGSEQVGFRLLRISN